MSNAQRSGILQVSFERPVETHYKFTDEMLMAIMLRNVVPEHQEEEAERRADKFIRAVENILVMIDRIFISYAVKRGLGA